MQIVVFTVEVCIAFTGLKSLVGDTEESEEMERTSSLTNTSLKSEAYNQGRDHRRKSLKKKKN